ncbi:MAG: FixH family protein [Bacteroidota bacterium]
MVSNETSEEQKKTVLSWGTKILALYLGFVFLILFMVIRCMMQTDVHLVSADYYKDEIAYQSRLDAINATPESALTLSRQDYRLTMHFKNAPFNAIAGEMWLYRPDNAKQDVHIALKVSPEGIQNYSIAALPKGNWHAKINWTQNGKAFFKEQNIDI